LQILEKLASFVPSSSSSTHDPQSTQLFHAKVTTHPQKTHPLSTTTVAKTLTNSFLALFGSNFSNPPHAPLKKTNNNNFRCLDVQLQLARNATHIQREKMAN
jgi:hypothetical protein